MSDRGGQEVASTFSTNPPYCYLPQLLPPSLPLITQNTQITQNTRTRIERQSRENAARSRSTLIALVDPYVFTRECITAALSQQAFGLDLAIVPYATRDEVLQAGTPYDVILYHLHEEEIDRENGQSAYLPLQPLINLAPVIVLGSFERPESVMVALENGVRGCIPMKSITPNQVIEIIRLIKMGETFSPIGGAAAWNTRAKRGLPGANLKTPLTPRERDVLALLQRGKANKIIAFELQMSESTARVHIRNIMKKLKVSNRTEAVYRAHAMKLDMLFLVVLMSSAIEYIHLGFPHVAEAVLGRFI